MRKLVVVMFFSCLLVMVFVVGGGNNKYIVDVLVNLQDKVSLQNGVKLFVNYCMGCYGMEYLCYGCMVEDLGIFDDLVLENLNFISDKIGDLMENGMIEVNGKQWFGVVLLDLILVVCYCFLDWIYLYLISFYEDEFCFYGYNNYVFFNVGMFYVMVKMQQELSEEEFKFNMGDIINFLIYVVEFMVFICECIGVYVLVFLGILLILVYLLKKEYWKDVY